MDGVGGRLRARARALGLSDAEVARRLGMGPSRYANYVNDVREPDFATFLRICRVLETRPGDLLGVDDSPASMPDPEALRGRIAAAAAAMDEETLRVAVEVVEALAARSTRPRSGVGE